jgi:hypothetical protein
LYFWRKNKAMCEAFIYKPIRQKDINWQILGDDDFYAIIKQTNREIYLRVEQMDVESWWTAFWINNTMNWQNGGSFCRTENGAKRQVLKALNNHLKLI